MVEFIALSLRLLDVGDLTLVCGQPEPQRAAKDVREPDVLSRERFLVLEVQLVELFNCHPTFLGHARRTPCSDRGLTQPFHGFFDLGFPLRHGS